jgi:hypothetical protein
MKVVIMAGGGLSIILCKLFQVFSPRGEDLNLT